MIIKKRSLSLAISLVAFTVGILAFQNCQNSQLDADSMSSTDKSNLLAMSADDLQLLNADLNTLENLNSQSGSVIPKVGIAYMVWHCIANNPTVNKVISQSLRTGDWGPIPSFHWRDVPSATNDTATYCAATNKDMIRRHFELLEAAKIDFLVVDFTNQSYTPDTVRNVPEGVDPELAPQSMIDGFKNLLDVSVERGGKIKIVPWVTFKGNLHSYFLKTMGLLPQRTPNPYQSAVFYHQGKPLIIASWDSARQQDQVQPAISQVEAAGIMVKKMWALTKGQVKDASGTPVWSFMEQCRSDFKTNQGKTPCDQYTHPELASVSGAYQETHMSRFQTAVPKFSGRTFMKQLITAKKRGAPLIVINTWNEWIAQRFCLGPDFKETDKCYGTDLVTGAITLTNNHFPYDGLPVFVDLINREYSRDFEPDTEGDEYYQLMSQAISIVKGGSRYAQVESVQITVGNIPGQTGHWWCENHFDRNLGPRWNCIGAHCDRDAVFGEMISCGK